MVQQLGRDPFCIKKGCKLVCKPLHVSLPADGSYLNHLPESGVLHRLMRSALLVLAMPRCRDASRNATLGVVESLIDLEGGLGYNILMAHVDQLLESLRVIAVTAWSTSVSLLPSPFPLFLFLYLLGAPGSTCMPACMLLWANSSISTLSQGSDQLLA